MPGYSSFAGVPFFGMSPYRSNVVVWSTAVLPLMWVPQAGGSMLLEWFAPAGAPWQKRLRARAGGHPLSRRPRTLPTYRAECEHLFDRRCSAFRCGTPQAHEDGDRHGGSACQKPATFPAATGDLCRLRVESRSPGWLPAALSKDHLPACLCATFPLRRVPSIFCPLQARWAALSARMPGRLRRSARLSAGRNR